MEAVGSYAGALRRAILAFKRGRRDVGAVLGALLAERLAPRLPFEIAPNAALAGAIVANEPAA